MTDTLSRVATPDPPVAAGTGVGRFVILEQLGEGGMSVVYAACNPALDRRAAVKLLRAGGRQAYRAERRARLLRAAQAMAASPTRTSSPSTRSAPHRTASSWRWSSSRAERSPHHAEGDRVRNGGQQPGGRQMSSR
jgi:serine/threonine protein kinase